MRKLLTTTLLVIGVGWGGGTTHALAQQKVTNATAAAYTLLPSSATVEKGLFKAEGLDVEVKLVRSGNEAIQALAAGTIEFAESSHAQFISAVASNLPLVAIGINVHGFPARLIALQRHSSLTNLADFKGKRIGSQAGTGVHTVLLMAIEKSGLKATDFTISNVRISDMPIAMQGDEIDAYLAWEPQAARMVESGRGKEVISADRFQAMLNISYPFMILTTEKIVRERPDLVQKYLNGYAKGQRVIDTQRGEAIGIYRRALPAAALASMTDENVRSQIYLTTMYNRVLPNSVDLADIKQTAEFMLREKIIKAMPDLAKVINLEFARQATANLGK